MEAPRVGAAASTGGVDAFNGHLIPNDYLRLVIGLWALDAVLFVAIGWLIGGLGGLRGLLPATLAAIVGGTVAFARDRPHARVAGGGRRRASALAVLLVGRDAIEAGAREVRVALAGTAVLVAVTAAAPAAATLVFDALGPIGEGGPSPSSDADRGRGRRSGCSPSRWPWSSPSGWARSRSTCGSRGSPTSRRRSRCRCCSRGSRCRSASRRSRSSTGSWRRSRCRSTASRR